MTEIQALIGIESLKLLEHWINVRQRNALILIDRLENLKTYLDIYKPPEYLRHVYYKFYFHLKDPFASKRDAIVKALNDLGIQASIGSCGRLYDELVLQPYKLKECPISEKLMLNSVMLLVDPTLNENTMIEIADAVTQVLRDIL